MYVFDADDYELPRATRARVREKLGHRGVDAARKDVRQSICAGQTARLHPAAKADGDRSRNGTAETPQPVLKPGPPLHPDHTREER